MFVTATSPGDDVLLRNLCSRRACTQVRACDMALNIPSKRLHFRSLANALLNVRSSLMYVMDALQRWDDNEWPSVEDTFARELSAGTMALGGVMDGLVILELPELTAPKTAMSFERTPFTDVVLRVLQEAAKQLRSALSTSQATYADFWSLVNFWKHYFPYQPRPSVFERSGNVRDLKVALGSGDFSGPIVRDLIVPTFNLVCTMMRTLSLGLQEPFTLADLYSVRSTPWSSPPRAPTWSAPAARPAGPRGPSPR